MIYIILIHVYLYLDNLYLDDLYQFQYLHKNDNKFIFQKEKNADKYQIQIQYHEIYHVYQLIL